MLVNKLLTHEPLTDKLCTSYSNIGEKEVVSSTYSLAVWECRRENGTKSKIEFSFMLRGQITVDCVTPDVVRSQTVEGTCL